MQTDLTKDLKKAKRLGHNVLLIFNELANCLVLLSLKKNRIKNNPRLSLEDNSLGWVDNGIKLKYLKNNMIYGIVIESWRE